MERAQITFEDTVVVAGCGPIGLGMVAGARAKNPMHVIALDMAPDKLKLAEGCGADITVNIAEQDAVEVIKDLTGGYGADVYLEGTGHPSAVPQGLNALRKLGRYVEYGVFGAMSPLTGASSATTRNSTSWVPASSVLLARRDQDDRIRCAAHGRDLQPSVAAQRVPEGSGSRRQRKRIGQSLFDPGLTPYARAKDP